MALILFTNLTYIKWFLILSICGTTFVIIENILSLFLFIMFSKYNWNKPVHLPQFLLNWIEPLYKLSQENNKGYLISLFLREIILYLILLVISIYMLYLI